MTSVAREAYSLTGDSLIAGRWVTGSGPSSHAVDPRSGDQLQPAFSIADMHQVDEAASAASEAFHSYRATTPAQRAAFLESIADNLEAAAGAITTRVERETGLSSARAVSELGRTVTQLRLFASVVIAGHLHRVRIEPGLPDRHPVPRADLRMRTVPVGPVVIFGASNFPLAFSVAGGDTASALAAGAPVIAKAHPAHPGTSELVGRAVAAAVTSNNLHPGVFSMIVGDKEAGAALVANSCVKAVGFTGSRAGGLAIAAIAAARPVPIPVFAEMSSVNPVFIMPGALADRAEELGRQWVASLVVGGGQMCTSPGVVFLPEGEAARRLLKAAADAISASTSGTMLSRGIADSFDRGVRDWASLDGVQLLARGTADAKLAVTGVPHVYVTTAHRYLAEPLLRAEVFGPAAIAVMVRDVAEMVSIVGDLEGQLTATIHQSGDEPGADELSSGAELIAGRLIFNGWPTGVELGHAMVHGGPFPATTSPQSTSVGALAVERFLRPVVYQSAPAALLPPSLADGNPLGIWREVDGIPQPPTL